MMEFLIFLGLAYLVGFSAGRRKISFGNLAKYWLLSSLAGLVFPAALALTSDDKIAVFLGLTAVYYGPIVIGLGVVAAFAWMNAIAFQRIRNRSG